MAIKSVQAIVNGVTTTLTYDSASKTYKATLTAPAKSSYNQSGHYYGVQIIAKDEAGNTTTVNQSDATLGSKLRLTVKEKTAPVITISSPTASQLLMDYMLQERFKEKVYKITLNGGMSCPNRDGTLGNRGCIFCSAGGSGSNNTFVCRKNCDSKSTKNFWKLILTCVDTKCQELTWRQSKH